MNKLWPIYVPSKGRSSKCKTVDHLLHAGLPVTIFVEPADHPLYAAAYPKAQFVVLPESNRGIGYVRQQILTEARKKNLTWYWMFDDDITNFYLVEGAKCIRTGPEAVLLEAQRIITTQDNVGQAGLEYQQFAWSTGKDFAKGSYCDVAVAIHVPFIGLANYRPEMDLKEDRDFTLQILSMGRDTVRVQRCAFSAPKNGSNEGGLHDVYAVTGREFEACERMVKKWPGVCEHIVKKDGRTDLRINWKLFRRRRK
jgi:hypothetical protein